jgi:hypothetical protein
MRTISLLSGGASLGSREAEDAKPEHLDHTLVVLSLQGEILEDLEGRLVALIAIQQRGRV